MRATRNRRCYQDAEGKNAEPLPALNCDARGTQFPTPRARLARTQVGVAYSVKRKRNFAYTCAGPAYYQLRATRNDGKTDPRHLRLLS